MGSNLGSVSVHQRRFNRRFDERYRGFGKDYIRFNQHYAINVHKPSRTGILFIGFHDDLSFQVELCRSGEHLT